MDFESAIIAAFAALVFSGFFSWLIYQLFNWSNQGRLAKCERELEYIGQAYKGDKGRARRDEKEERQKMAMAEAIAIFQDSAIPDKMAALKALGLRYPDVAMDLLKKGGL